MKFAKLIHFSDDNRFFMFSNATWAISVHSNFEFFLFSLVNSEIKSEKQYFATFSSILEDINSLNQPNLPKAASNSFLHLGGVSSLTAETFSGSAENLSLFIIRPRNFTLSN